MQQIGESDAFDALFGNGKWGPRSVLDYPTHHAAAIFPSASSRCPVWAAMAFARLGDTRRAWELMAIINPVNHSLSATDVATYKTEPYALAADVYAVPPHTGRGGWSWMV